MGRRGRGRDAMKTGMKRQRARGEEYREEKREEKGRRSSGASNTSNVLFIRVS